MTFIQSSSENIFSRILCYGTLVAPLLLGALWLVTLYNQTVNLKDALQETQKDIQTMELQAAELKNLTLQLLGSAHMRNVMELRHLVEEKTPSYFEIKDQWVVYASR